LHFAPGNGGTREIGTNVPIDPTKVDDLVKYAEEKNIDLTVVGGEDPLPLGIVNRFRAKNLAIFGPTDKAAQLESSKDFAKTIFMKLDTPTAKHKTFSGAFSEAMKHVEGQPMPVVIKADGLAAGKGSFVCHTYEEAKQALQMLMVDRVFGKSGSTVVIEDFLVGRESSVHALSDGNCHMLIPTAWQDHKYLNEATEDHPEGTGQMTGGMGTYGPVPWMTKDVMADIDQRIVTPIFDEMRKLGMPFTGCLFPGLMMTKDGPKVLETNVRPGAPETESLMRQMENPLEMFNACAREKLDPARLKMNARFAVCLVLASSGYPEVYTKGHRIVGIENAMEDPDVQVFHAGTLIADGTLYTNGGRVLSVTATGKDLFETLMKAYDGAVKIQFLDKQGKDTKYYRKDIGHQGIKAMT
jgi:phosphoribosylamine--glycine ligase